MSRRPARLNFTFSSIVFCGQGGVVHYHRVVIKAEGTSCQFSYCLLSACSNLECPLKGISGISAVLNLKGKECKFSPYAIYFMYFR